MGVTYDDGFKYVECDGCHKNVHGHQVAVYIGSMVYHEGCTP